ncbi:MAG: hypothetical protein FWH38_04505 [Treponema sp.]|nr:hypothetical protein [Treponema sp.]
MIRERRGCKLYALVIIAVFAGCLAACSQNVSTVRPPPVTGEELLTLAQEQTFKYFWDYGHPVSGMARERDNGRDLITVTTGGTGFGVMAILAGAKRGFITREEAVTRLTVVVDFLREKATAYHGAYAHWINGNTGATIPFSPDDNGADLVETAFLFQGLLAAYEYFKTGTDPAEAALCGKIQAMWEAVEWDWFTRNGENRLYWHWSPNKEWIMNMPLRGWNETLIVYVLAAASPTHGITKDVYNGWGGGSIVTNQSFYGIRLPMGGFQKGGPLFFTHYSFMGLDPRGLKDENVDYWEQVTAQAKINYLYCVENPLKYSGYGPNAWGLTASNTDDGYNASAPVANRSMDKGIIAPTGALSSFPYTPDESMAALEHYYNDRREMLWGKYGFYDAFRPDGTWYDTGYLAIDQGPIVVMIENYRSGLLWRLFMGNEDIRNGLSKLGFTSDPGD